MYEHELRSREKFPTFPPPLARRLVNPEVNRSTYVRNFTDAPSSCANHNIRGAHLSGSPLQAVLFLMFCSKYHVTNVMFPPSCGPHLSSCAHDFLLIHTMRVWIPCWDPYALFLSMRRNPIHFLSLSPSSGR